MDLLASDTASGRRLIEERAERLERQALRLRALSDEVHAAAVREEFEGVLEEKDGEIDLIRAGLVIAKLDNPQVDIDAYVAEFERMAKAAGEPLAKDAGDEEKLARLRSYLFEEAGFHGSRGDYYNRSNSYLNEVLDDREGIPITLSVIYMELARKLNIEGVVGVPLPGHFVVGRRGEKGDKAEGALELTDVFEGAKPMSRDEANELGADAGRRGAPRRLC